MSGLEQPGDPPGLGPAEEPPETAAEREREWAGGERDMRPAVGTPAGPAGWERADADADVAMARPEWGDAVWSFLYKRDTDYASVEPAPGQIAEASLRARGGTEPGPVNGPFLHAPLWTWEVPTYFWVGGIASGAAFVAFAADLAGDHRSARIARLVALGAIAPAPVLLISDLGRPARFLNMLRVFKPRSPMNVGAWCLMGFSATLTGAVGADRVRHDRTARALGGATAVLGGYLGSYTGVLLAATAIPVWARSRYFLGPVFVATATATGAAATRLALVGAGLPQGHPTRRALSRLEAVAMGAELTLSQVNERRIGDTGRALEGRLLTTAKVLVNAGFALQLAGRRLGPRAEDAASVSYLLAGLAFRFAWVEAGKTSARDDAVVADTARGKVQSRATSRHREPSPRALSAPGRAYSATVRRLSLLVEGALRRP